MWRHGAARCCDLGCDEPQVSFPRRRPACGSDCVFVAPEEIIERASLVGAARFELATPSPPDWCANRAALRSELAADYSYPVPVAQHGADSSARMRRQELRPVRSRGPQQAGASLL